MNTSKLTWIFVAVLVAASWPVNAGEDLLAASRTISVRGVAEIAFPADHVTIFAAVVADGNNPESVQHEARDKAAQVLEFVRDFGVEAEDVSTNRVSLRDKTEYFDDDDCPRTEVIPKYEAKVGIRFVLRDLKLFDELMNGILDSGVNRILSVSFDSSERIEKAKDARKSAIRAAKEKADYLAGELGQVVGNPIRITEVVEKSYFDRSLASSNSFVTTGGTYTGTTSMSPEEQIVSATVEVIFELSD